LRIAVQYGGVGSALEITLDDEGRIGSVFAPRKEDGRFVERRWRSRFSDYGKYQERWLPFKSAAAGF
jgi:hypothetical protein